FFGFLWSIPWHDFFQEICEVVNNLIELLTDILDVEVIQLLQLCVDNLHCERLDTHPNVGVVPFNVPRRTLEHLVRPIETINCHNLSTIRDEDLAEFVLFFGRITALIFHCGSKDITLALATERKHTFNQLLIESESE